jgi:hypothetical protein
MERVAGRIAAMENNNTCSNSTASSLKSNNGSMPDAGPGRGATSGRGREDKGGIRGGSYAGEESGYSSSSLTSSSPTPEALSSRYMAMRLSSTEADAVR